MIAPWSDAYAMNRASSDQGARTRADVASAGKADASFMDARRGSL